jgi:hypothetical protein
MDVCFLLISPQNCAVFNKNEEKVIFGFHSNENIEENRE